MAGPSTVDIEHNSASAELVRAQDSSQLQKLVRHFGLDENDYLKHQANLDVLIRLKSAGCDFDRHIWPAALKCRNGKRVHGLAYIEPIATELRDAERAITALPKPFEDTDERGWKDRQRTFRTKGMWSERYGPKPGEPGCRIPEQYLEVSHGT